MAIDAPPLSDIYDGPGFTGHTTDPARPGARPTAAIESDVFAQEPGGGAIPHMDPRCAPRPLADIRETKIVAGLTQVAALIIPTSLVPYEWVDIQWDVDYDLLWKLGFLSVRMSIGDEQDIAIPFPEEYPLRYYRCFEPGTPIKLFVEITAGFPLEDGTAPTVLATPVYVRTAVQLGYAQPQYLKRRGAGTQPEGTVLTNVFVPTGAALFNPFAGASMIASRLRVHWPFVGPPGFPGQVQVTANSNTGVPGAPLVISNTLGIPQMFIDLRLGNITELVVGDPLGTVGPPGATLTVEWDQWRKR
jgi:hypothetical protein